MMKLHLLNLLAKMLVIGLTVGSILGLSMTMFAMIGGNL